MRNPLPLLATLAFVANGSVHASASEPVRIQVGSPQIHGASLQPYETSWRMQVTTKDATAPRDAGVWRDRFEVLDIGSRTYGVRTQDASFTDRQGKVAATTRTINVFDRDSMAPVSRAYERHVAGKPDSVTRIAFAAHALTIETRDGDTTLRREADVDPAFDFDGGMFALLWSTLPLKPDFAATLPSYAEDEHPEKVTWRTFKVVGKETVDAGHLGRVDCWIVEGDSGSGPLKYWISEKPPYVIQLQFEQGQTGATWLLRTT